MTLALQDPVRQRDPTSRHAFPDIVGEAHLRAPSTLAEELLALSRTELARARKLVTTRA
jgi:hypothetical protein